uniref:Uncharacterized protein n=1 Tax=Arundo donax TaxID=35708 RepID=A0A0A9C8Q0_ARUDO
MLVSKSHFTTKLDYPKHSSNLQEVLQCVLLSYDTVPYEIRANDLSLLDVIMGSSK